MLKGCYVTPYGVFEHDIILLPFSEVMRRMFLVENDKRCNEDGILMNATNSPLMPGSMSNLKG